MDHFSIPIIQRYEHLKRYREILGILAKHGFGYIIEQLGLARYLGWPRRLLTRGQGEEVSLTLPEHLRLALEELGPTFIKLGQILSTRPDLVPPDYLAELVKLQDEVPPFPFEEAKRQIERELGRPIAELFHSLEAKSLAAASLGQVHRAILPSGEEVVVKVQRPGIERTIRTDLEILFDLARLAQERIPQARVYDLPAIAQDFADTLWSELDYRLEGHNADRFRKNFAQEPALYVPKVHWEYTTRRVLTLERISGIKISDLAALDAAGVDRYKVAENSTRIILKEIFEDGFFHADPHPGNFFVMPDGVIGAMDFGMVGYIDRTTREKLLRLFIVALRRDAEGIVEELEEMGMVERDADRSRLKKDLEHMITKYYGLTLKQLRAREVRDDAAPIAFRYRLKFPTELWLLAKTAAMLEGIGVQLAPELDVFALAQPYFRQALAQMASPRLWARKLASSASDWGDLLLALPQRMPELLDRIEAGDLEVRLRLRETEGILSRLDRIANRLVISVLAAAFIVALALLIVPLYSGLWQRGLGLALVALGLVALSVLGLWLLLSIWRSG